MRRAPCVVALCALILSVAAPASAQRDPFEPAIEADSGGTAEQPTTQVEPQPGEAPPPQPLAPTGAETRPWLALAYALIALGVGALAVVRITRLPAR